MTDSSRAFAVSPERARQLEIGARRRVDPHDAGLHIAPGAREWGMGAALGALDIGDGAGSGCELGQRELAEGIERGDLEIGGEPLGRRRGINAVARLGRDGGPHIGPDASERVILMDALRDDDLARIKPCDLRGEPILRNFG